MPNYTRKVNKQRIKGGMISSPAAYPQGTALGSSLDMLPGVQGSISQYGNHYPYNPNVEHWPDSTRGGPPIVGGRRRKQKFIKGKIKIKSKRNRNGSKFKHGIHKTKRYRYQRGGRGGIIPEMLVNGVRGFEHGIQQLSSAWQGLPAPSSPFPVDQSLLAENSTYNNLDLQAIASNSDNFGSKL